ncbi:MAG: patatin-like phospholipase family protein [Halioglobus sp.]|nr:patatin-like phospholipase family protein [Halioglobus sp.]
MGHTAGNALRIYIGREAARRIAATGWSPNLFDLLLGASGGAKWLVLSQLDRLLFGEFLAGGTRTLTALGSSIGAWRHTCLALPDPVAAIDRMQEAYLHQQYSKNPDAHEVSEVSLGILEHTLGNEGPDYLLQHPRIKTHIITSRGKGAAGSSSYALLASAMGSAALGNAVSRKLLQLHFQRVVFHNATTIDAQLKFDDFDTQPVRLTKDNVRHAIHASGSIPFVLSGERDITGAPPGHYWDGGIIDYHFDLTQLNSEGLILYPHFSNQVFPGWFDKFLPWRLASTHRFDRLVLLCPSAEFVASLPYGKIPDRGDFKRLRYPERIKYWETCIAQSQLLADAFANLLSADDPLSGCLIVGEPEPG